ncbi:MAG: hypothetical protein PHH05_03000 [Syntrophaceticus sp.]|nr:hypothetical protein [Syntrophaceticus sp.]
MPQLNEQELQNVRHFIGSHETCAQKLKTFAQQCQDPQIKEMFQQSSQQAENTKQKFISVLQ